MAKMLLKLGVVVLAIFLCVAYSNSYAQQPPSLSQEITISTHFPAPYGFFKELRLIPHNDNQTDCISATQGTVRLDEQLRLWFCDGKGWRILRGGYWNLNGSSLYPLEYDRWKVGIGTSTPAYELDVAGKMNSRDSVCIGSDCKPSWDAAACPDGYCMTYANFNVSLQGSATSQSSTTYTCTPCGGTTGTTPPLPGPNLTCRWISYPPGHIYTQPFANACGSYTGVLWFCSCPPGYTDIINMSCSPQTTPQRIFPKKYYNTTTNTMWMYCEGTLFVGCYGGNPVHVSAQGRGTCAMYQP